MRNFLIILVLLSSINCLNAQKKNQSLVATNQQIENNTSRQYLRNALQIGDVRTAIVEANRILVQQPDNGIIDTLIQLYHSIDEHIIINSLYHKYIRYISTESIFETVAGIKASLGLIEESTIMYEQIKRNHPNDSIRYNYKLAEIFLTAGDVQSCTNYINRVLNDEKSELLVLSIPLQDGTFDKANYYSAALNILGVLSMQQNKYIQAENIFTEILSLNPNFKLAQGNYELLKKLKNRN